MGTKKPLKNYKMPANNVQNHLYIKVKNINFQK